MSFLSDASLSGVTVPVALSSPVSTTAGVEADPSDAMLTQVVVASAGRDLAEEPDFLVS